jgi:hypothetical protein
MGGFGSGPRRPGGRKRAVEDLPALDLGDLGAAGALAPGRHAGAVPLRWRMGDRAAAFTAEVGADAGAVRLTAGRAEWEVGVVAVGRGRAGRRWQLACPVRDGAGAACGRRAGRLYVDGVRLGCRACLGLTYLSTRESDPRVAAAIRDGYEPAERAEWSAAANGFDLRVLRRRARKLGFGRGPLSWVEELIGGDEDD